MRAALLICLLTGAAATACGPGTPSARVDHSRPESGQPSSSPKTRLAITVYPNGIGGAGTRHYELSCNPPQGTAPRPATACRVLARSAHPFAPVPPGMVCGEIVLGPQEARITGVLRDRPIGAVLTLRDTCEIGRWNRLRGVVPGYPRR